jgi:hypothetical protein
MRIIPDSPENTPHQSKPLPHSVGGVACGLTDALQRLQNVLMRGEPVCTMAGATVDMVPGTVTTHEIPLTRAVHGCV